MILQMAVQIRTRHLSHRTQLGNLELASTHASHKRLRSGSRWMDHSQHRERQRACQSGRAYNQQMGLASPSRIQQNHSPRQRHSSRRQSTRGVHQTHRCPALGQLCQCTYSYYVSKISIINSAGRIITFNYLHRTTLLFSVEQDSSWSMYLMSVFRMTKKTSRSQALRTSSSLGRRQT